MELTIVIYPFTTKISNDHNSIKKVITEHTRKEWMKIIEEFKDTVKEYRSSYGVKVTNVEQYKNDFIRCDVKITNKKVFSNHGKPLDIDEIFVSFLNHNLNSGGYPSFYNDNLNTRNFMINRFIVAEITQ